MANSYLVQKLFRECGAVKKGEEYKLSSGLLTDTFYDGEMLATHPAACQALCDEMAREWAGQKIEVVVGVARGGIIIAYLVAQKLTALDKDEHEVVSLYVEKKDELYVFKSDYDRFVRHKRVLIVDDVATGGRSIMGAGQATGRAGGVVVGASVYIDRGDLSAQKLGVPIWRPLATIIPRTWKPGENSPS